MCYVHDGIHFHQLYIVSTVGVAVHCFNDVNRQAVDLAIPHVPLDSKITLTGFLTQ
jgi:hypothetical protein